MNDRTPQTQNPISSPVPPSVLVRLGGDTVAAVRHLIAEANRGSWNWDGPTGHAATIRLIARDLAAAESADTQQTQRPNLCADPDCPLVYVHAVHGDHRAPSTNTPTDLLHNVHDRSSD